MSAQPSIRIILGQPSWRLASTNVEAFVTELGGHLGPVTFDRQGRRIRPLHVAPWAQEPPDRSLPAMLRVLRGDFFCLPFGGNQTPYHNEHHPPHGETANRPWTLEGWDKGSGRTSLHLSLRTRIRRGRVDKHILLVNGHQAVYCRHVLSGMSGPMSFGHHAMLAFPDEPGSGHLSTSPFVYAQVLPEPLEQPAQRGYSILKPGAPIRNLARVPTVTGETADLSRYPARRGYEDLVQLVSDPKRELAWTAVAFPAQGYVWFALKDPRVLASTIFWISNGGRHYPPWNGRHLNVMGLEEVTSYFHFGLQESASGNPFQEQGFQTAVCLEPKQPLTVNYIMAVAAIPADFDRVKRIEPCANGVRLLADSGSQVEVAVETGFLYER